MTLHSVPIMEEPHGAHATRFASAFGILGGPLAWFLQMCAGYALASWPCFPKNHRMVAPLPDYDWTFPAMIIGLLVGVAIALAAFFVSWSLFRRARSTSGGSHSIEIENRTHRTRFLALWGMLLGAGFALTTIMTAVAFAVLPRCAG
jgi:hypothetical protein